MQLDVLIRNASSLGATRLPALESLLAVANQTVFEGGAVAWLCRVFGVARQQDLPIAPFAAKSDGLAVGSAYWLRATPVNLQVARDSIVLAEDKLNLSAEESQALVASLAQHFDDMSFFAPHPQRWYVRLESPPDITTTLLEQARGSDVSRLMPQGADAKHWRNRLNEMQMLLHAHPVNESREAAGKLTANGLWFCGGGVELDVISSFTAVLSDDVFLRGLARAHPVPSAYTALADASLIDIEAQRTLEQHWFAPLLQALKAGQIDMLKLHLATADKVYSFNVSRRDLWKIWRKKRPLPQLIG